MRFGIVAAAAALTLAGLAAWPSFVATREARAASAPAAAVLRDDLDRARLVAFYEDAVRRHPDQIVTRLLAAQYLQRFREAGDADDLVRAEHAARASLAFQPRFNTAGELTLSSALVALHRFREALVHAQRAHAIEPSSIAARAQIAGIEIELGDYDAAQRSLHGADPVRAADAGLIPALARYDEVTGRLANARRLIDTALESADAVFDAPAESRAWYHVRAGDLAWSAGDAPAAVRRYREALAILPDYERAWHGLARVAWGGRRWRDALDAATRASDRVPLPETLGFKTDAERALGDEAAARATGDLIGAIERAGNARGLNDRALALYLDDHGGAAAALAIARRDAAARDDVFGNDLAAWTLARNGRWNDARRAARKALRIHTEDARLAYHAGVIAMECGARDEAVRLLHAALARNPDFDPFGADDARARLGRLER